MSEQLLFLTDDAGRYVARGELTARRGAELRGMFPQLGEQLEDYCEALLYLELGPQYELIKDPEAYRQEYPKRFVAAAESDDWEDGQVRLSDLGLFDVSELGPPVLDGERLVFYVEITSQGAPAMAVAPAPGVDGELKLSALPQASLE